ncbi:MAG TPA: hypothetical protein VFO55_00540 [Gemmatimonadaceae bacterium]|nr:hypothetical protein [Gemmatimonadaceae bacterium]
MNEWLDRVAQALRGGRGAGLTDSRVIDGLPVEVINTRDDISTERVFERARAVLERVRIHQPPRYAHLKRDLRAILVARYACRAAYFPDTRTCLLELTFMVNPDFSDSQVAASLVHEGMHARLDRLVARFGIRSFAEDPARHERICRRAELNFGYAVPDGGPVVDRALQTLALADDEVAPAIDWRQAARNIEIADERKRRGIP